MRLPLKITTTGGFSLSEAMEAEIREKAERLDHYHDGIMSCRVTVDAPARHHRVGSFNVRIDLTVPGKELVVDRQQQEDLQVAIREAFAAARRRLEDHARLVRGDVKTPEGSPHGLVARLFHDQGYGFLRTMDGREIYFHRNSVLDDAFDRLEPGAEVRYAEEMGRKGPQASTVALVRAV